MKKLHLLVLEFLPSLALFSAPLRADADLQAAQSLQNAFVRVAEKVGPAVVSIAAVQDRVVDAMYHPDPFIDQLLRQLWGIPPQPLHFQRRGLGSGMIINKEGDILTNAHVIKDADRIEVTLADGRVYSCEVRGADLRSDLAVIRIIDRKPTDPELPCVVLGDSDTVRPGQWSVAIGNPFGITEGSDDQPTVTVGVISAIRSFQTPIRDFHKMIQTDAAINPGNSGGPLCNINGEVIGVNTFIVSAGVGQSAGVGFAIPINRARAILADLQAGREIRYGWLGVEMQEVSSDLAEFFGLEEPSGVLVKNVIPDGPAATAGIQPGDLIIAVNGEPVRNGPHLVSIVTHLQVGSTANVTVNRDGKKLTLSVTVGARPSEGAMYFKSSVSSWRGAQVVELPKNDQKYKDVQGVLVEKVTPNSPAARAGLEPGDVIQGIGKYTIRSLDDFRAATRQLPARVLVRTLRGFVVIQNEE
ncbi:MAG: trypsin-like peptidase domain-containing protein [bacterium]|nr:trypsin-like peptidase domain-containing protein [bacterium]